MKTLLGRIAKTNSLLAVAVIIPLVFLIVVYVQSRYGASEESTPSGKQSPTHQSSTEQGQSDHIRTLVVKRLLNELDSIDNMSPKDKRELEKILREADRYLAEAATTKQGSGAFKEERLPAESSEDPQTAMVRALLQLLDEVIEDNLSDRSKASQSPDELRESLLRADQILRQYLGDSARARIEAANRKPAVPRVFNPPRRKPADSRDN